ncbi:MAG: hypothetical protein IPH04_04135 [Saprospirales bacterium]|nr:hypothetical protein [Saprospirales bacterium]
MMNSKSISVAEALKRLNTGDKIEGVAIDFKGAKVKALDAFKLGKAGVQVPDEVIVHDDTDVAYDPDFDEYEWKRTDIDPFKSLKERLTVNIEIEKDVEAWIQKNGIEIDHLLEKLIHDFYSSNQMIKGK